MINIRDIFERITESYDHPIAIGSRCESNIFYRVEELSKKDIQLAARFIADRMEKVCSLREIDMIVNLRVAFTELAATLSEELGNVEVIEFDQIKAGKSPSKLFKNRSGILVNDVITTARSCLECHSMVTMSGGNILAWAALIDRTFGPGPVPVVASFTGEPIRLT